MCQVIKKAPCRKTYANINTHSRGSSKLKWRNINYRGMLHVHIHGYMCLNVSCGGQDYCQGVLICAWKTYMVIYMYWLVSLFIPSCSAASRAVGTESRGASGGGSLSPCAAPAADGVLPPRNPHWDTLKAGIHRCWCGPVRTLIHRHKHAHTQTYTWCTHTYIHTYIHTHTHTHTHTRTHTHTYTHTETRAHSQGKCLVHDFARRWPRE